MSKVQENLGKRIIKLRKRRAMMATELADEAGMDKTYISLWENGKLNPTLRQLVRISEALGCNLQTLVRGIDD